MTEQGAEPKKIAEVTGVHVATIYRELKKGADTEGHYKGRVSAAGVICIKAAKVAHALFNLKGIEYHLPKVAVRVQFRRRICARLATLRQMQQVK